MANPPIQILLSAAALSVGHAFWCDIRLTSRARELASRVREVRPDLWAQLNPIARSWNGGHPGLKLLHRRGTMGFPELDRRYEELRDLERRMLRSLALSSACIALVGVGIRLWGWHW